MNSGISLIIELLTAAGICWLLHKTLWRGFGKIARVFAAMLCLCALFVSFSGEDLFHVPERTVTVTALGDKAPQAENAQIYLKDLLQNGKSQGVPAPAEGLWSWYNGQYCWFEEGDERRTEGQTDSVTFMLPVERKTELVFSGNKWKGMARVQIDGEILTVDTFRDTGDSTAVTLQLPSPEPAVLMKTDILPLLGFALCMLAGSLSATGVVYIGERIGAELIRRQKEHGLFHKLLEYHFLFEELIARDFKKKYKRTALGMAWSVLSPLMTLLVMRIVFTQFFGRNMEHYTTYLFCGNLVFMYFNDATSQGMTSLMENASIFTKVNVPKYLFLFSKNIQTLINFGLTLCVFFVFCMIDQITFTWRFCLLLYPIFFLMLFNMGVGLILSALFVFFRDVQYLWSVFTQLLMYVSAIFYTIDGYGPVIQNIFLLNPVYLFIRYFRKIVIEATVPSVWFHLLMMADAGIVLGIGCWIYKKYNTRFLYYV